MKKIAVENAVGLTICHDMTQILPGKKGPVSKRACHHTGGCGRPAGYG